MKRQRKLWMLAALLAILGTLCRGVVGMRFSAALLWCACIYVAVYAALDRLAAARRWALWGKRVLLALFCAGLALFAALEALVLRGARTDPAAEDGVSCVVILGAGVNGAEPSAVLRTRLNAALDYLADKPDLPVIVSGGQGAGEDITEAECMARWLVARGVDESRVWKEEASTSTRTNFDNSLALMAERGIDPTDSFAFVTSDFHICRAKLIAGVPQAYGVAATLPDGPYFAALTANYYVREAFALANERLFGVDL